MVSLTGERVDVHFLRDATNGEWDMLASEVTDKTGRLVCPLPAERCLGPGLHPIKMVVRGDHTYADLYVAVLPPKVRPPRLTLTLTHTHTDRIPHYFERLLY